MPGAAGYRYASSEKRGFPPRFFRRHKYRENDGYCPVLCAYVKCFAGKRRKERNKQAGLQQEKAFEPDVTEMRKYRE